MIWCTLNPRQARLLYQRNRFTSDPVPTATARFSWMCLGSVCDRVFELSPFVLRGGVVELQTLKTVPLNRGEQVRRFPETPKPDAYYVLLPFSLVMFRG